jgi:hypothetical protein
MAVAEVSSDDPEVSLIAWSGNGTKRPNALVVLNKSESDKDVSVAIRGAAGQSFAARVTTDPAFGDRDYDELSAVAIEDGRLRFAAPARSATTFTAE